MKADITIAATIPTGQYQNIQPKISFPGIEIADGQKLGMEFIQDFTTKYGELGPMKESDTPASEVQIGQTITLKSFNEDVEVYFDPIAHTYITTDGKKLIGGSTRAASYYKEFGAPEMSKICAKHWSSKDQTVAPVDIEALWKSNGNVSSSFGTSIHEALEHFEKFHKVGHLIACAQAVSADNKLQEAEEKLAKKEERTPEKVAPRIIAIGDNYALPKHPLLRQIVLDFYEEFPKELECESETEVLVTEVAEGKCGRVDKLTIVDKDKKVCRIKDYKIKSDIEEISTSKYTASAPFDKLDANKLSESHIQISDYAKQMIKSGWTVEGLDIFVYDGEWKKYTKEVLLD